MGARNIYNEQAVPQWRSLFFYICGFSPHVGTSPYVGTCRGKSGLGFSDVLQHVRTFGVFRPVMTTALRALYFWCDAYPIMGLSTTAHPPGAYGGFHVGTSPYVGTCRGKSGLGFMVWSLDESLSCFQTCYSTSVRSGRFGRSRRRLSEPCFFGAMSTP